MSTADKTPPPVARGTVTEPTATQLDALSAVSEDDVADARAAFRRDAQPDYRTLLDARPE